MNTETNEFERRVHITGAFDKRHADPSKNYGIHGMEMRFVLIGPKGATQFVVYTGIHLPHVADEMFHASERAYNPFHAHGADIGFHSREPMYDGHQVVSDECEYLGGPCYYDGSGLQAEEFMPTFLSGGSDVVWPMLEQRYRRIFESAEGRS